MKENSTNCAGIFLVGKNFGCLCSVEGLYSISVKIQEKERDG
jgi:hypothetical protein